MSPCVSVIIPAYNQGHFLAEAINSVRAQTFSDLEIIVVDDGSTDHTAEVVQSYADPRLRYHYKENGGLSSARNAGMRQAQGEILSFLDSDDLFLPQTLETLVDALEENPAVGLAAGQSIPVNEKGEQIGRLFDSPLPDEPHYLLMGNPVQVGSMVLRRDWQEKVGFFDESLRSYEDWDMWLRLGLAGCPMLYVPKPMFMYRFHTAQMTRDSRQMTTATFAVLDKTFANPDLPESWRTLQGEAYSQAYLRKTAQAYRVREYRIGQESLLKAVELNQTLVDGDAGNLANRFSAWVELPKTPDKFSFLEDIYNNLPPNLTVLQARRRQDLGRAALQYAYESYAQGDMAKTRSSLQRVLRYQPSQLTNRGAASIFLRAHIALFKKVA